VSCGPLGPLATVRSQQGPEKAADTGRLQAAAQERLRHWQARRDDVFQLNRADVAAARVLVHSYARLVEQLGEGRDVRRG
jgi:hypothetical protein